jgi:CBS domain-containing protein
MTSLPPVKWASSPLSIDQEETLNQVERALTVRLIATLGTLITTTLDARVSEALKIANKHGFDYLPVRRTQADPIIGIFSRLSPHTDDSLRVSEVFEPLGPNDLISAETSLLNFLWSADEQPRRLVLEGTRIDGIVTLSDIQKLPVRMALFSLFIHFELLLNEQLRRMLGDTDPWVHLLPQRAERVRTKWQQFAESKMEQDIFSAMDLCDKRETAKKLHILDKSPKFIEKSIKAIELHLRNPIAHGAEYAQTHNAALKTIRAARATRDWIRELQHAIDAVPKFMS